MWIKEVRYGTIDGGPHAGTLAFHIQVTAGEPEPDEIADAIMAIREFPAGPGKTIRLFGEFPQSNDAAVMTLLTPLKNYGYYVIAEVPGQEFHQWYNYPTQMGQGISKMVDWLVFHITDAVWPPVNCQELRYHLRKDSSRTPVLPEQPGRRLVVPEDISALEVLSFLRGAEEPWAIYLETKKNLSVLVWGGEE